MLRLVAVLVLCLATARQSFCEILVQESFDYAVGDLTGKNGGVGFSGVWTDGARNTSTSTWRIGSGSLSTPNFSGVGNSVSSVSFNIEVNGGPNLAGSGRNTSISFHGAATGQVSYLSFLINRRSTLGNFGGFGGIYVGSDVNETTPKLFIGKGGGSDNWAMETLGGTGVVTSTTASVVNETTLLVVKMETLVGSDRFTLYVNPTSLTEPVSGFVKSDLDLSVANRITMYQSGAFSIDEIRVGTTFLDVTAVPEPTSICLTLAAMTGLAGFYLKKQLAAMA